MSIESVKTRLRMSKVQRDARAEKQLSRDAERMGRELRGANIAVVRAAQVTRRETARAVTHEARARRKRAQQESRVSGVGLGVLRLLGRGAKKGVSEGVGQVRGKKK